MFYVFLKLMSWIAPQLPPAMRRGIGNALGNALWPLVSRRRRGMAESNIMRGLGVDLCQAQEITKQSAVRFGRMLMEILCLPTLSLPTVERLVAKIEGLDYLRQAQALGRGVILVTAHSDNWELIGPVLALQGFPMVGVAQKQHNEAMDRFMTECRTAAGMKIIYKTEVRPIMRGLLAGGIVGLIIDQDAHEEGAFVEFLGQLASTPKGAAVLARLQDAPIVPAFIHEQEDGRHVLTLQPPIRLLKTADREQDIQQMTERLTKLVEDHVRRYPAQWFWLHNRWKTLPPM